MCRHKMLGYTLIKEEYKPKLGVKRAVKGDAPLNTSQHIFNKRIRVNFNGNTSDITSRPYPFRNMWFDLTSATYRIRKLSVWSSGQTVVASTYCIVKFTTTYVSTSVKTNVNSIWVKTKVQTLNKIVPPPHLTIPFLYQSFIAALASQTEQTRKQ